MGVTRRWLPRQVLVTRSAAQLPHGQLQERDQGRSQRVRLRSTAVLVVLPAFAISAEHAGLRFEREQWCVCRGLQVGDGTDASAGRARARTSST